MSGASGRAGAPPPGVGQLPLGLRLRAGRALRDFVPGGNAEALAAVSGLATGAASTGAVLLRGPAGTGKTHLLEGACAEAAAEPVAFVPLRRHADLSPDVLRGLGACALVCLDDVDAVAGRRAWEEVLFHLCNEVDAAGARLAVSARLAPAGAGFALPDLASRLAAAVAYRLEPLGDDGRREALVRRAAALGFGLADPVVDYILARCPRDLHALMDLLDRIDRSSLAAKRPVTVPFVRDLLDPAGRAPAPTPDTRPG